VIVQRIMGPAGRIPRLEIALADGPVERCGRVQAAGSRCEFLLARSIVVKRLLLGRLPTASVNRLDGRSWHLYGIIGWCPLAALKETCWDAVGIDAIDPMRKSPLLQPTFKKSAQT
jgi:hypothetical protein